jgi:hypothetical protein
VRDRELLRLMRDPEAFRQEVEVLPRGAWVVVDEVQRLPSLLLPRRWRSAPPRVAPRS